MLSGIDEMHAAESLLHDSRRWQYMQPTLGGPIDAAFFAKYDAVVQAALQAGAYVILDCHNVSLLCVGRSDPSQC